MIAPRSTIPTQKPARFVVAVSVHTGHLGRLSPHERGPGKRAPPADAGNDLFRDSHVEPAGGKVVEEEHRLRAVGDDVVHAHRHEVDPDGVVPIPCDCEFDLRADTVGAGDQHGVPIAVERRLEQRAEAAKPGDDAPARGVVRDPANALHEIVAAIDIDTGIAVTQRFAGRNGSLDLRWYWIHQPPSLGFDPNLTCHRRFQ